MTQPTATSPAFDRLEIGTLMSSRGRTIGEADLTSFAALTGDWHPQHADAEWAAAGPFGERIAHGMLVLSYAFGLLPIDPERVVALRSVRRIVFKRPVAIGTTIIAEAEVASLRPLDDEQPARREPLHERPEVGGQLLPLPRPADEPAVPVRPRQCGEQPLQPRRVGWVRDAGHDVLGVRRDHAGHAPRFLVRP